MESILGAHTEASSRQELVLKSAYTLYDGASGCVRFNEARVPRFFRYNMTELFTILMLLFNDDYFRFHSPLFVSLIYLLSHTYGRMQRADSPARQTAALPR